MRRIWAIPVAALAQSNGRNPVLPALLKPGVRSGTLLSNFRFAMTTAGLNPNGWRTQDNLITHDAPNITLVTRL